MNANAFDEKLKIHAHAATSDITSSPTLNHVWTASGYTSKKNSPGREHRTLYCASSPVPTTIGGSIR